MTPPRIGLDAETVVATAARLANAEGFEGLTLARLAAELGVRSPSLYNHIDGLGGVRRALQLRALHLFAKELQPAVAGKSDDAALAAVCRVQRALATDHPGLYAAMQPSVHTPNIGEELRAAGEEVLDVLIAVVRSYGLEDDDALHAVRALRSSLHGFIALERAGAFGMAIEIDESFERLVRLLADGFRGTAAR